MTDGSHTRTPPTALQVIGAVWREYQTKTLDTVLIAIGAKDTGCSFPRRVTPQTSALSRVGDEFK